MTDKEKLIKIKSLADKMYYAAFNLTTDASLLRKAMDEYHQFIINEYRKEEQIIKELQEKPVNKKKCMFTKDSYTDEDRKVLCEDCKEKCEYNKKEEPVSEELEEAVDEYAPDFSNSIASKAAVDAVRDAFKAGAKWQKEQMIAKAIDGIARPDDNEIWCNLSTFNFKDGDKCKVILIKEDRT